MYGIEKLRDVYTGDFGSHTDVVVAVIKDLKRNGIFAHIICG
jgi:hypothetical protein